MHFSLATGCRQRLTSLKGCVTEALAEFSSFELTVFRLVGVKNK